MDDLRTYWLKSGSRHGGQTTLIGFALGQPQGEGRLHVKHLEGTNVSNPSFVLKKARCRISPSKMPNKRVNPGTTRNIDWAIEVSLYC